ncbi:hypothetical protein R5R35_006145 [Gryllus longicercus]|uniref:Uncharacterized protein n=1 Tax=Gryllus longicercus TaxID=2509291 RepID=A0AAN9V8P1_9ORTH
MKYAGQDHALVHGTQLHFLVRSPALWRRADRPTGPSPSASRRGFVTTMGLRGDLAAYNFLISCPRGAQAPAPLPSGSPRAVGGPAPRRPPTTARSISFYDAVAPSA